MMMTRRQSLPELQTLARVLVAHHGGIAAAIAALGLEEKRYHTFRNFVRNGTANAGTAEWLVPALTSASDSFSNNLSKRFEKRGGIVPDPKTLELTRSVLTNILAAVEALAGETGAERKGGA